MRLRQWFYLFQSWTKTRSRPHLIRIADGLGTRLEYEREQASSHVNSFALGRVSSRRSPGRLWMDLLRDHTILRVALGVLLIYMLLTVFSTFLRNLFFDQFICMIVMGQMFIFVHFNLFFGYKLIGGSVFSDVGLVIQSIIDGFWLYYYGRKWWSSRYIDSKSLMNLRYLVWVSSVVLIIVRFLMIYILHRLSYLKLKDDEEDLGSLAPAIQDVKIDQDFSRSDILQSGI